MAQENYDLNALFHPNVDLGEKSLGNKAEYSPSADKGQSGVYKSIIRFVTWWQDPQHSFVDKWACWLVDPVTNRGKTVDCPSSVGKPSPLQDMFFKLRKSESIQDQKKSEIFSRKHVYAAIIQVIKDDQNKELEGKLLIWRFGKKIFEKIEAEKKPVIGEAHEPFDLLDGKAFALVITKNAGFNNYDQARFLDKKIPLLLPTKEGKLQPINERTPRETVFDFLKTNSPDLSKYGYKEWDQETHEYVNQVIVAVTGQVPSTGYADVRNQSGKPTPAPQKPAQQSGISTTELSLDDLVGGSNIDSLPNLDLDDLTGPGSLGLPGDLDDAIANL
jgi:gp32 DNA binding protein like